MATRTFNDDRGRSWQVWSTIPEDVRGCSAELAQGWLTFECGDDRRRLAPIPAGWETAADNRLDLWCKVAKPARARTSSPAAARVLLDAQPDEGGARQAEDG